MFTALALILYLQISVVASEMLPLTPPVTTAYNCKELTLETQNLTVILHPPNSSKEFDYLVKTTTFCQIPILILSLKPCDIRLKRWKSYAVLYASIDNQLHLQQFYQIKPINNATKVKLTPPQFSGTNFSLTLFDSAMVVKHGDLYTGNDVEVISLLFSYLKIPYTFTTPTDGYTLGDEIHMTGAIGQVIRGEAEMVVNSQILNLERHLVDYTYPFLRDDVILLVPKTCTKHHPQFYLDMVAILLIVFSTAIFVYFKTCSKLSLSEIVMVFLMVFTVKPIRRYQLKWFRIFYGSVLVGAFFTSTLAGMQFFSRKTVQCSLDHIKTLKSFAKTGTKIFARPGIVNLAKNALRNHPDYANIVERMDTVPFGPDEFTYEWNVLVNCSPKAIICRKGTFALYAKYSKKLCYYQLVEPLMPSLNSFVINCGNAYYEKINTGLGLMVEAGLILKPITMNEKHYNRMEYMVDYFIGRKLGLVYGLAMVVAIFVCVGEILWYQWRK